MKTAQFTLAAVLVCSLAACGGGGGSASGAAVTAAGSNKLEARAAGDGIGGLNTFVSTSGIAEDAILSTLNQRDFVWLLVDSIIESNYIGYAFRGQDAAAIGDEDMSIAEIRHELVSLTEEMVASQKAQARPINATGKCESGKLTIAGELDNNTGAGVVSVDFDDCRVGSVIKRGRATITINKMSSGLLTDYAIGYEGLTFYNANRQLFLYTGSQHAARTLTNGLLTQYVVSSNLYRLDQTNNRGSLDQTINTTTTSGKKIEGRLCDGPYGCVNLSTRIPFRASEGEATMAGQNGSKLLVYLAQGKLMSRLDEGNGAYQPAITH